MADDNQAEETLGEAELVEGLEKKKFSGKKIIMLGGGAVVLLAVGFIVMSLLGGDDVADEPSDDAELEQLAQEAADKRDAEKLEQDKPQEELALLFYELPPQLYNLNTGGDGTSFLKTQISLEIDRESYRADLEVKLPRILDEFNTYMRELRPSDLEGAAGVFRLKEELLMRINQAVAPTRVKDVLFQEFLIQG
ncbi:flagellar basal body-associated FliL family protein [Kordiimonas laminariae]|uniref:flagellar basal body-associated FliL family protein n=1 Tax=Kordiimonas laminariae TaxID=2917717 RepID=UPI001FF3B270|nr:flagellar basal body-associated FliL family protein [Kordiimonas laminariae]MCK0070467.1 flagellar basal body-associated FliL family protein [Kordiimonas laminariae]